MKDVGGAGGAAGDNRPGPRYGLDSLVRRAVTTRRTRHATRPQNTRETRTHTNAFQRMSGERSGRG